MLIKKKKYIYIFLIFISGENNIIRILYTIYISRGIIKKIKFGI